MGRRIRVGVIFGGRSGEHEVSLLSAASVIAAIDRTKYEVIPVGVTKEGRWMLAGDVERALGTGLCAQDGVVVALPGDPAKKGLVKLEEGDGPTAADLGQRFDVVFPVLHGPYGEDGTVQGLLELAGIPYVGAGVLASAVGMDKILMKTVFKARGLPVLEFLPVLRKEWKSSPREVLTRVRARFSFPVFVKPANLGSSVGVSRAEDEESLARALDTAALYDRKMLVERAAPDPREVECSVLGNDEPAASVVGEVVPAREFYDYEAKYHDSRTRLVVPADIPAEKAGEIRAYAVEAFKAIDCAGMARVDFFLSRETQEVFVNEINTIPGFTAVSMYPKLWEASGIGYAELIDRLIELALERFADRQRCLTTYERGVS